MGRSQQIILGSNPGHQECESTNDNKIWSTSIFQISPIPPINYHSAVLLSKLPKINHGVLLPFKFPPCLLNFIIVQWYQQSCRLTLTKIFHSAVFKHSIKYLTIGCHFIHPQTGRKLISTLLDNLHKTLIYNRQMSLLSPFQFPRLPGISRHSWQFSTNKPPPPRHHIQPKDHY